MKTNYNLETIKGLFTTLAPENTGMELGKVLAGYDWANQYLTLTYMPTGDIVDICHYKDTDTYEITTYGGDYETDEVRAWAKEIERLANGMFEVLGLEKADF